MKKTKKIKKVAVKKTVVRKTPTFWEREIDTSLGIVVLLAAFFGAYWFIDYAVRLSGILQSAHIYAN